MKRLEMDGYKAYDAIIIRDGVQICNAPFRDWFENDVQAVEGYKAIMLDMKYHVLSVTIGFPCVVTVD